MASDRPTPATGDDEQEHLDEHVQERRDEPVEAVEVLQAVDAAPVHRPE